MQKITTFLTFKDHGAEAVRFYVSVFRSSRIEGITLAGEGGPLPKGALLNASFVLDGQEFMAMDGGSYFSFAQGISLFVSCETQAEIDYFWEKLSEAGEKLPCGWLRDRYGVSWQIIPTVLGELMSDKDPAKAQRVMAALLQMGKIDIETLRRAYAHS
jgi:predicted 3-demethylubiquinone-9 3-methyltransferase (glyoxalase superfamily)